MQILWKSGLRIPKSEHGPVQNKNITAFKPHRDFNFATDTLTVIRSKNDLLSDYPKVTVFEGMSNTWKQTATIQPLIDHKEAVVTSRMRFTVNPNLGVCMLNSKYGKKSKEIKQKYTYIFYAIFFIILLYSAYIGHGHLENHWEHQMIETDVEWLTKIYEKVNPENSYVRNVSIPRLNRFKAKYPHLLKKAH